MKISEKWLREWANPTGDLTTLLETLTMAGLEVESFTPAAGRVDKVVVAEVLDVQPHPNADRLRVCRVNTGTEILQIVCGAKNVAQGLKVPAALIGAELSGDLVIKASQLRGVDSFGMLCAASELGLNDTSDGLLVLPDDAPVGMAIQDYLQLDDHIIEISLTPNRGDCLSIQGLAREVSALMNAPLTPVTIEPVKPSIDSILAINLQEPAACPVYVGRIIKGIQSSAVTPLWMKEKLRRVGLRSIHPVVDVTNFVMLELGQPMHAFDLAKLDGGIQIRLAQDQEPLILLDDKPVKLDASTLVIADDNKVLAIAGVMGGADSAVSEQTTDIFLESAFFTPAIIAGKARAYGLHTDSAHRFERGVDPTLAERAIERATALLLPIVGGTAGPVTAVKNKEHLPAPKQVDLRLSRINRVLGTDVKAEWVAQQFPLLGFALTQTTAEHWTVAVPAYRFDINIEADLVEEAARLYGYNNIAYTMPMADLFACPRSESHLSLRQIKQLLAARNYCEAITYSFVEPKMQELLDPALKPYVLANPISPELSVMRTSLWQSLMTVYIQNLSRQSLRVRLFEQGLCFKPSDKGLEQLSVLAGLCAGTVYSEQWGLPNRTVDFFDIKKDIEALFALRHDHQAVEFIPANIAALHPGRSAAIMMGKQLMGYVGELHPRIMDELGLRQPVYLFELFLDQFSTAQLPQFATLSRYPSVRRDIALVVEQSIPVDAFKQTFTDVCGDLLVDWQLFDVYQGENITANHRSLAFGLVLQHASRTLTDIEIADCMNRLVIELHNRFGAVLRE